MEIHVFHLGAQTLQEGIIVVGARGGFGIRSRVCIASGLE